ncbi:MULTISPECIES: hypothetical protein [unclassified Streptomyces]|uniref:hypothetical protein n=1 Tax=unclassified Streptomyces TaxID=2593676 RepID=UPI002E11DB24|nr:hypothetical protein OG457_36360 [Streptomyces sp. NBC_01207]WTA21942.1 hypothetical protein OG365_30120 [Streptomyces sp. NBC_00853]
MSADVGNRPKPFDEVRDVYDVLEHVRLRPGMFVRDGSLQELMLILSGYGTALRVHDVGEQFDLAPVGPFADWLRRSRGWSTSCGWATAIELNGQDEPPLSAFFRLLDEWRATTAAEQAQVAAPCDDERP